MSCGESPGDAPSSHHTSSLREHKRRRPSTHRHPDPATIAHTVRLPVRSSNRRASTASYQTVLFRAAAPPVLFAVLIAGLLVELRARVASPAPAPDALPPGVAVSMRGNTAMQCALVWAESHWPGPWALPVLCAGALGALRAVIWAFATLLGQFGERVGASDAARVKVGRWEDGGSVSGGELLAGMFT